MPITGGIKFFGESVVLAEDGATITASTGQIVAESALDKNPYTFWESVGSDDTTTETLTIVFDENEIDRLFLQNHNWKDFNVQYWTGVAWAHFASVVGIDGSKANITETAFAQDTAYYEFTAVTTTKLRIQVLKTQVVDDQKYIAQVIACTEIGTLQGWPKIKGVKHSRNSRKKEMLSGKVLVQPGIDSFACKLDFQNYPTSLSADLQLAMTLFDREDPFLVWLCGGAYGPTKFRHTLRGFRLQDVYLMHVVSDVPVEYMGNGYLNPVGVELALEEHV
jgi:hypothetical protein